MANVRRSPQAEADLDAILADLDQKDPAVADRYAAAFEAKGQALAQFPELGRRRPEIARGRAGDPWRNDKNSRVKSMTCPLEKRRPPPIELPAPLIKLCRR